MHFTCNGPARQSRRDLDPALARERKTALRPRAPSCIFVHEFNPWEVSPCALSALKKGDSLPLLLKYADAARELSVSERYIFDLIDLGLLKRVKLGGKAARVTRDSLMTLAGKRQAAE